MPTDHNLTCPECGSRMELRPSKFGLFYGCTTFPKCDGTHGAHSDGRPLGTPATKATRDARMDAHTEFDTLWERGPQQYFCHRSSAYRWMQRVMGLTADEAHFEKFDEEQCAALIEAVEALRAEEEGTWTS